MMVEKVLKNKNVFTFYFDDGKTVKYDLATQETIGKNGKPVKDLKSQLSGIPIHSILSVFEDKAYADFLKKLIKKLVSHDSCYIKNFGTLIEKSKENQWLESWFKQEEIRCGYGLGVPLNKVPKWLLKTCKERKWIVTKTLYLLYKQNPVSFQGLFSYISSTPDFPFRIQDFVKYYEYRQEYRGAIHYYMELTSEKYGYKHKPLLEYIKYLAIREAEDDVYHMLRVVLDEANMRKTMAIKKVNGEIVQGKFEMYPKYLRTTHNITSKNFSRFKKEYSEELFENRIRKELEYDNGKYCIVHPRCTDDIKMEAVNQGNCVAGYIQSVIDGNCSIVFLRKSDEKDKSMVTVEIRKNKIVQTEGTYRRDTTEDEKKFLKEYTKKVLDKLK